ncbi:hypothetical protein CHARACLAT_012706, partial [Characodon lateralis]|nr:hypothetical protein [Characodon lateralis]
DYVSKETERHEVRRSEYEQVEKPPLACSFIQIRLVAGCNRILYTSWKVSVQRGCPGIHCLSVARAAAETLET